MLVFTIHGNGMTLLFAAAGSMATSLEDSSSAIGTVLIYVMFGAYGAVFVTVLIVRIAGRIYAGTLLAGGKMTWASAFRAEPVR